MAKMRGFRLSASANGYSNSVFFDFELALSVCAFVYDSWVWLCSMSMPTMAYACNL